MDFDPAQVRNCLCANLRKTDRAVTRAYDKALAGTGLNAAQFAFLSVLAETGPIRIGDAAAILDMDQTTATRNVGLLGRAGLVETAPGADKRETFVALSVGGRRAHAEAAGRWAAIQAALVDAIGAGQAARLLGGMAALRRALRESPAVGGLPAGGGG